MALHVKVLGAWRNSKAYAKVSGAWRDALNIYVKISGAWRAIWSYSWQTGAWGGCSASCGGGAQYRTVTCQRSDGMTLPDAFCVAAGAGAKPAASQSCNTQSCEECRFDGNNVWNIDYSIYGDHYSGGVRWDGSDVCGCYQASSPIRSCYSGGYYYWLGGGGVEWGTVCRRPA